MVMGCTIRRKRTNINITAAGNSKTLVIIQTFLFSLLLILSILSISNSTKLQVSSLRLARIEGRLEKINRQAILTIQSPDGDIIDCVDKRKQPALDHPLLKNHKIIQRFRPDMPMPIKTDNPNLPRTQGVSQIWHQNGTNACPKGSVPVRRTMVQDVLRANSLYDYGKKKSTLANPDNLNANDHEHAIAYATKAEGMYGAKATINVWNPFVQEVNEFSLSQIWVLSGSFDGSDLNSVEAGWQVNPELYGDTRPRLFTYWTNDAYKSTGCYNLLCPGFVQTNSRIAIGAAISPLSSMDGSLYDITLLIWKDPKSGDWWLAFGDSTLVGYWPSELFTHLSDRATMVEWGGEIVNSRASSAHTSTQMGSGYFAEEGYGKASYFRSLQIVDSTNSLGSAKNDITELAENSNCYDIQSSYNKEWGFVQTNSRIAIGAAISPLSSMDGSLYDITLLIWKSGDWWLAFGDNTLVGYWPSELFTHLSDRATMVEWGGEIVNSRANSAHTSTQMGSGYFAEERYGKASYFRSLQIVDSTNSLGSAKNDITEFGENSNCYDIQSSYNKEWGTHFYYGGPGRNPKCP